MEKTYFAYLQQEYLNYFEEWTEESNVLMEKNREGTLVFGDLKDCFEMARSKLNGFYREFRRTNSFEFLELRMLENDRINARLYDFNILRKLE